MAINKTPTKERRLTKITLIKEYIRGSIGCSYFITISLQARIKIKTLTIIKSKILTTKTHLLSKK